MNKRGGGWGSMAERLARGRGQEPSIDMPPEVRHCWVTTSIGRHAGLLVEWRQVVVGAAWEGRVVHPIFDQDHGWVVAEEWLPAGMLEAS